MYHKQISIILVFFALITATLYIKKTQKKSVRPIPPISHEEPSPPIPPVPEPPKKIEPKWQEALPLRPVTNLGEVLSDIDSHMPAGHIYRDNDKVTWGHETSHGISSRLRQLYTKSKTMMQKTMLADSVLFGRFGEITERFVWHGGDINAFYVLKNRAVVLHEPKTTMSNVRKNIPKSLQGMSYNLYLVTQARDWNNQPLYIVDEFNAYTNGSAVRLDLKIPDRQESVQQMMEFGIYTLALAKTISEELPSYRDREQFEKFVIWNIERTFEIYQQESGAKKHLEKFKTASDAEALRTFTKKFLGNERCNKLFGF